LREAGHITVEAVLGLITPLIIVGGIVSGSFTPTESSAIAVVWALFLTVVVYKELKIRDLPRIFGTSIKTISVVSF